MYRVFPLRASAERKNAADAEKRVSDTCGGKSFKNLSVMGKKKRKGEIYFERFFAGIKPRKPIFSPLPVYTAKNGKT